MSPFTTFMPRIGFARAMGMAITASLSMSVALPPVAQAAAGPPLVMLPASGRGVSAAIIERARALLVRSLGQPGRLHVVDFDRPPTPVGPATSAANAMAQYTGARIAVWLDLSRDQGRTVFEIWCWDVLRQRAACHLSEATTAGPDSLPDFTEWIAMRLMRTLEGTGDEVALGDPSIAAGPSVVRPRAPPRWLTFGVRAGLAIPVESPARDLSPMGRFGLLISGDFERVLADISGEYQGGNSDHHVWGAGVDLLVPLGRGERFPYAGGGAWLVDQTIGGRGASGLQLRPTVGMLWGRHDVARLRVDASYFVDLFEERELDRLFPGSGQAHLTHGLMISTGATF